MSKKTKFQIGEVVILVAHPNAAINPAYAPMIGMDAEIVGYSFPGVLNDGIHHPYFVRCGMWQFWCAEGNMLKKKAGVTGSWEEIFTATGWCPLRPPREKA